MRGNWSNRQGRRAHLQATASPAQAAREQSARSNVNPLDELDRLIGSRMVLGEHERTAVCLWIGHTYVYDRGFFHTPRLFLTSIDPECGKSALMRIIAAMSRAGIKLESGSTLASIRDLKEEGYHTLCLDQLDEFGSGGKTAEEKQLSNMLCSGFEIGAKMALKQADKDEGWKNSTANFGFPIALGKIRQLPGAALQSRCIVIQMQRETEAERNRQMDERMKPLPTDVTDRFTKWAEAIKPTYIKAPKGIGSRAEDAWQPLLNVARHAGSDWEERARKAMEALSDVRPQRESEAVEFLRRALVAIDGLSGEGIYTSDLDQKLGISAASSPINSQRRGYLLKEVGVKSANKTWQAGGKQRMGYALADIRDAGERWLPREFGEDAVAA